MPAKPTLKPCPFCGSEEVLLISSTARWVRCPDCCVAGPVGEDNISAIRLWNKRVTPKEGK